MGQRQSLNKCPALEDEGEVLSKGVGREGGVETEEKGSRSKAKKKRVRERNKCPYCGNSVPRKGT